MCYTLDKIKEKTTLIAKLYGIQSLVGFGSYARNETTEGSDIEFLMKEYQSDFQTYKTDISF